MTVLGTLVFAALASQSPPLELDDLVRDVEQGHPSLKAAASRVQAAVVAIPRARAFAEPVASIQLAELPTDPRMWMMPRQAIASPRVMAQLGWMAPIWGKRGLKADMAEAMADMARADERMASLGLRRAAKVAFWELWLTDEATRINGEAQETLAGLEESMIAQYATGRPVHHGVLRVQSERETIKTEAIQLQQRRLALHALINALRGKKSGPVGSPAASFTSRAPLDDEKLLAAALSSHPDIAMRQAQQRGAEAEAAMARRELIPDPMFMIMAESRPGDIPLAGLPIPLTPMVGAGVSIPLPVFPFSRQLRDADAAQARARAAENDRLAVELQLSAEIQSMLSRITTLQQRQDLVSESLQPRAREALEASLTAVASGQASALEVLDARRQLQNVELEGATVAAEREAAIAELESVVASDPFGATGSRP